MVKYSLRTKKDQIYMLDEGNADKRISRTTTFYGRHSIFFLMLDDTSLKRKISKSYSHDYQPGRNGRHVAQYGKKHFNICKQCY